jgi:probable DNA metabolism protein
VTTATDRTRPSAVQRHVALAAEDDFDGWRDAARSLALAGVPADRVTWSVGDAPADLFAPRDAAPTAAFAAEGSFSVPRPFVDLARSVICHSDPERFALLYGFLVRLRATPGLIGDAADPKRRRLEDMAKQVRRDIHKMRAFLRFRELDGRFVAWFEPEHHIVRTNAAFFVRRFTTMRWSILTPELSIHWDGDSLTEGPGAERGDAPEGDPIEDVWKSYYAAIFNPARVKIGAMLKEMPKKYWKNMPETALVPQLIAGARERELTMIDTGRTAIGGNSAAALDALREEAMACTRCPLWKPATQTVFGEGPVDARIMLVGEQPGDQEDLAGHPFVGPAGQMLDRALAQAGIDRATVYVTNAVKHFKFEQRGKRRIHAKPGAGEIEACRWWIDQERMLVRPAMTIMLGATAARALLGKTVTIGRERGRPIALEDGGTGWVTVHPSYLLRIDDADTARDEYDRFVADLAAAHAHSH